jgi:PEGA domain-containing protein
MELEPFIAKTVNPGEPLTAQAWNDLVTAIDDVHEFLRATTNTVQVRITNTDLDPLDVRVTASRADAPPVEAVRPVGDSPFHTLSELEVGTYTIRAEAPGFQTATTTVNIGDGGDQTVPLTLGVAQAIMPNLFGVPLQEAVATLQTLGATVSRCLDFNGNDVPPLAPPPQAANAPVLVQQPAPGTPLTEPAQLVVAIAPVIESAIVMPSLAGLTEAEARRAIEAAGLQVGRVKFVSNFDNNQ